MQPAHPRARLSSDQVEAFIIDAFGWVPNTNQEVGVAWDATMPKGSKVEIKTDLASTSTGNYFLEYWQTFDAWTTIKKSGIALACIQSKYLCIVNHERLLLIETRVLRGYLYRNFSTLHHRQTGDGANGNREGCHTAGLLVPTSSLIPFAKAVYDCINPLTSDWEFRSVDLKTLKEVLAEPKALPQATVTTGPIISPFRP